MKWNDILKVIQIPNVNLDEENLPPEYEEKSNCRKELIMYIVSVTGTLSKIQSNVWIQTRVGGSDRKPLTLPYVEKVIMSLPEEFACEIIHMIKNRPIGGDDPWGNEIRYDGDRWSVYFSIFEPITPIVSEPTINSTNLFIWKNGKIVVNIEIELMDWRIATESISTDEYESALDEYTKFVNTAFKRNESPPDELNKEDILKVIQIPKVNLDEKDKPPEYDEGDECKNNIILFTDSLKRIEYPHSDIERATSTVFGPGEEVVWTNTVYSSESENYLFEDIVFNQEYTYEFFIHNRRIKDGMRSSNLPEEVACRILELFEENKDRKKFRIKENIKGFKIEYEGMYNDNPNTQELYTPDNFTPAISKPIPEVKSCWISHNLSVMNPKGLDILEVETEMRLKNILCTTPFTGDADNTAMYDREAKELFMWFPNVRFDFIYHYANIGKLYDFYKKGVLG